jgi:hypothetical protein
MHRHGLRAISNVTSLSLSVFGTGQKAPRLPPSLSTSSESEFLNVGSSRSLKASM